MLRLLLNHRLFSVASGERQSKTNTSCFRTFFKTEHREREREREREEREREREREERERERERERKREREREMITTEM